MSLATLDTIWVCEDCLMGTAYGDYSGLDYQYSADEASTRMAEITAGIASFRPATLHPGDGSDEFSYRTCECCGSHLAGTRHEVIVFGEEE